MADDKQNIDVSINQDDENEPITGEFAWAFPEFKQHEHSRKWWIWFIVIDLALLLFALFTTNFLFALIIVIITGIIIFREYHGAEEVTCSIADDGIGVNDRLYEWREIENFWFAYEPPEVKELYFKFKSFFSPSLTIPLQEENPIEIRKFLSQYIEEDLEKEGEPTSDALGRVLKL